MSCMRLPTALLAVSKEAEVEERLVNPAPLLLLPLLLPLLPPPVDVPPPLLPLPLAELIKMLVLMLEATLLARAPVSAARLVVALAAVESSVARDTLPERALLAMLLTAPPTRLMTLLVAAVSCACTAGVRGAPPPPLPALLAAATEVMEEAMEEAWLRMELLAAAAATAAVVAALLPLLLPLEPLPLPLLLPLPPLPPLLPLEPEEEEVVSLAALELTATLVTVRGTPIEYTPAPAAVAPPVGALVMTVPGSTPGPEMGVPTLSVPPPCTLLTVSVLPEMLATMTGAAGAAGVPLPLLVLLLPPLLGSTAREPEEAERLTV